MFDKIYSGMKSMSFLSLLILTALSLVISYVIFSGNSRERNEKELTYIAEIVEVSDDFLKSPAFSSVSDRVTITSADKTTVYFGKLNPYADYSSKKISNDRLIFLRHDSSGMRIAFLKFSLYVIIAMMLIYVICQFYSAGFAEKTVRPLKDLSIVSTTKNCDYPELNPLVKKITSLNIEINHQREKTKRQKVRLQAVSENMNEGLIVLDKNRDIISANQSILNIFKCEASLLHQNIIFLTDNEELLNCIENAYSGKKTSITGELSSKSYRFFFSPVYESENIIGVIILIIDISDEIKNIQIRREFSANVSHELKTPLTTILGYSQIINNGIAKKEDITAFTRKIENETSRLIVLIDDIIKISKLDEGISDEETCTVNLLECANETALLLENRAEKRGITIKVSGSECSITANRRQIDELIFNLCDNAIKYNNDNGTVDIKITENGFSVSDTGIGIPAEHHERIFERFFRVDKSRSKTVNGTGLGLSIVKHIIICLGASIDVESTPGSGTTFKIKFPEEIIL